MDRLLVMQLVRSFERGYLTRREFVTRAAIALGSVAAAHTVLAACAPAGNSGASGNDGARAGDGAEGQAADVDSEPVAETPADAPAAGADGLTTESVTYEDTDGETLTAYLARPEGDEALPAVIVIQEWWGLNEHIEDVARRVAAEGYVAVAPDLYHGAVAEEPDEAQKLVMELDMEEAVREIQRAVDYALARDDVAGREVGIVGFCMGGRLVLTTALAEERLGAAVAFYGRPLEPAEAPTIHPPLLGLYGSADGGIPVADVEAMGDALAEAGHVHEIHVYDGAQHAFFNDTRPDSHDAEASADAWRRTIEWFQTHLE